MQDRGASNPDPMRLISFKEELVECTLIIILLQLFELVSLEERVLTTGFKHKQQTRFKGKNKNISKVKILLTYTTSPVSLKFG